PPSPSTTSLLRDQLAQFDGSGRTSTSGAVSGRGVLGWLLSLCGIALSAWVVFAIHTAVFHPERLGLPLKVIKVEDLSMTIPSGEIQLPPVGVTMVAYFLTVLLLAVAGRIAVALLKLGASLVIGEKLLDTPR